MTGFVAGDTLAGATTGTLGFATTATASSNVGSYAINGAGLAAVNGDYTFVQATGNAGALSVTPAPLTVTGTRIYDTTTGFATGTLTLAGAQNGETVGLTAGSGTSSSADVGAYPGAALSNLAVQVAGGNATASNYRLPTFGVLTIMPATVAVAGATGVDKTYDGTTALPAGASGFTASGIYGGDASRVAVTAASAAYAKPDVGPEAVDVAGLALSGAAASNYVLSATSVTGAGTIAPASSGSGASSGPGTSSGSGTPATPSSSVAASDLGSVLITNLAQINGTPGNAPPLLVVVPDADATPASVVQSLSDPRSAAAVVCVGTTCAVVPPPR